MIIERANVTEANERSSALNIRKPHSPALHTANCARDLAFSTLGSVPDSHTGVCLEVAGSRLGLAMQKDHGYTKPTEMSVY